MIEIYEGIPNVERLGLTDDVDKHKLLILDDLVTSILSSSYFLEIFVKTSHHCNLSISQLAILV